MAAMVLTRRARLGLAPATTAALLATTALVSAQSVLPTGGQVVAGSATISASGPAMIVKQGSQRAIVNWQSFSVGQPNGVHFAQPSASSAILNRVTGSAPSTIAGYVSGNGQVFLVNPNGIAITPSGTVKVGGGFVASTLDIGDQDFLAGRLRFSGGPAPAAVSNAGAITAGSGGFVGLLGGVVSNGGTISVPLGKVGLGAATQATLDPTGDGFLQVAVPSDAKAADGKPLIDVSGKVSAHGGRVEIKAATAQAAVRDAINISGRVSARSVSGRNGSIVLGGGDGGNVRVSGTVSASGRASAGRVAVSGRVVEVAKGASVRARSKDGQGGTVALKGAIVNNIGTVDAFGASGGAIDVAAIDIGSYGVWDLRGAVATGGAFTARGTGSYVETTSGVVLASGATGGGRIAIDAPNVFSSGHQDASSWAGRGGHVTLTGERIALVAAAIDASGAGGGGSVRIGGDYQGGGTLAHAATTTISPATTIRADATQDGDGGSVVVWSAEKTDFYGTISARGGQAGGKGGLVEVSSKGGLIYGGKAAVDAPAGANGVVLLDPKNIIIDDVTGTYPQYQLIDPLQGAGSNQFGTRIVQLQGAGKTVVTAPGTAIAGQTNAGAVYLYDTVTGALISSLTGSTANDRVGSGSVTALSNGNYVVRSGDWDGNKGAVTWGSGTTGVTGIVSSANSLVGSIANDQVGSTGITLLGNGNYLVRSSNWDGNKGAVTWGSGTSGVSGVVSASNSLVGSTANDWVGNRIELLSNGNYLVSSYNWGGNKGAVTWGSGTSGVKGVVSASNSLVGSNVNDGIGNGIHLLSNGNYFVISAGWNGNKGAVTWGSGTAGVAGVVSAGNSLVGSTAGDMVGARGITELSDGNYVVNSPFWNGNRGAVTRVNGAAAMVGALSASNSLVGSTANDYVGYGGSTALSNGNYVVNSPNWNGGRGAVTWVSGGAATAGTVSASNSLVGSIAGDQVGNWGIRVLSNGNYVVNSPNWNGNRGAVTWINGAAATTGIVSASNSLVGSSAGDQVGYGGITLVSNGNYVVRSSNWDGNKGAVTWGSATGATVGAVSSLNSLVGSAAGDQVGNHGIMLLTNGNYVVNSYNWDGNKGAVTWGSGTAGVSGVVSSTNSLVGSTANDFVGVGGVAALSNGNYVVNSYNWSGNRGAVTWGDGASGVAGVVDASNSLVGSNANDRVGGGGITALSDSNYVVSSYWNGNRGAVTWGSGASGIRGIVDASHSLFGSTANGFLTFKSAGDTNDIFIASSATDGGSGRVYVGLTDLNALTFGRAMAQDVTIRTDAITRQLNAGSALTLQASNDITVNSAITVNNPAGNGGDLTLQAGRSILVNAAITTDNGNLTLIGNDRLANGVVDAQRDPGAATIALNAPIDAGTGTVDIQLRDGAGKTNSTGGTIALGAITASTVSAVNSSASGGLTLNGTASASGTGDAIVLASNGAFTNNAGASALSLTGGGRWLVYSSSPAAASFGNLDSGQKAVWNASYFTLPPASVSQTGNRYLFAYQPTLTYTSTDLAKNYGDDATAALASAYTVSGLNTGVANAYLGDTLASVMSGAPVVTSAGAGTTANVAGTPYAMSIAAGSVTTSLGYLSSFVSAGKLTVAPRAVTVTASAGQGKVYGEVDPALAYAVTAGNTVNGDSFSGALARATGENVGGYAIGQGTLANPNYAVSFVGSSFGITPRAVTVTASSQSKSYGDATTFTGAEFAVAGLVFGDTVGSVSLASLGAAANANAGSYAITASGATGGTFDPANYVVSYGVGQLTVAPRAITIVADAKSRVYGDTNPALTYAITAGGLVNGDLLSGTLGVGATADSRVGAYTIAQNTLTSATNPNYAIAYLGADLTVMPRLVTYAISDVTVPFGTWPNLGTAALANILPGDSVVGAIGVVNGATPVALSNTMAAGSYVQIVTALAGGAAGNYLLSPSGNRDGVLTVTPPTALPVVNDGARVNAAAILAQQPLGPAGIRDTTPGPTTGYVETSPTDGFRLCSPVAIASALQRDGQAQLASTGIACGM